MAVQHFAMEDTLRVLLEKKRYTSLKDVLATMQGADVAALLGELSGEEIPVLFRLLPKDLAAETFVEMDSDRQELLIRGFSDAELSSVINELFVDDAAALVEEMPANVVQRILHSAEPALRQDINAILRYPENSAGSIMTTEFVSLPPDCTVGAAIAHIRRCGVDKETIYTCYVTDQKQLLGFVTLRDLLLCGDDSRAVSSLMDEHVISVPTSADREDVVEVLRRYDFVAVPVVDTDGRLVGIVTFDDAMDIMAEVAAEDMEIMGGVTPSSKTYLRSSPGELFLRRIPWLMLLMVSATFTGLIITGFESALSQLVVLTAFIPMLMDTGGNSGSQSSVTVIRALSLGELELRDLPGVLWKELRTSLLCGAALSALCFVKILLVDALLLSNPAVTVLVAGAVSLTLLLTVIMAKLVGCTLPILANSLGFDPAVMASPFITTIVDALSLLVYFGIASALLF